MKAEMRELPRFVVIVAVFLAVGCRGEIHEANVQLVPSQNTYIGNWHVCVPEDGDGKQRHEYYAIREDHSVVVTLRDGDQRPLGKYQCRLENSVILFESGFARWPIRKEGDSLILVGDKEYRLSRVDEIPAEHGQGAANKEENVQSSTAKFVGRWHMFVSAEEDGPHHEFYEIREDRSVVCWFVGVDRRLVAKFHGQLNDNSIISELGHIFPLKRDGDDLIIQGEKEFTFSRIEELPPECM